MAGDRLAARDLMVTRLATVERDRPLSEVMESLLAPSAAGAPNAVVVVDREGRYEGILTAKLILARLLDLAGREGKRAAKAAASEPSSVDPLAIAPAPQSGGGMDAGEGGGGEGEGPRARETDLLDRVAGHTERPVADFVVDGIPTATPGERVFALLDRILADELEYLPVVEDARPAGLIPATELFYAIARIALTPGDEGIRLER